MPLRLGEALGVGVPARNGELPGEGEVSGRTGGAAAVGVLAGAVGLGAVGVGEGCRDFAGVGEAFGDLDRVGDGFLAAGFTTMLPLAEPAAPLAVTGCVVPPGPAT